MRHRLAFWIVAAASLLVAHDLVYLVQLGPGRDLTDALRTSAHGYWPLVSAAIAIGGIVLALGWMRRLGRLGELVRPGAAAPGSVRRLGRLWFRLLVVIAIVFVLQENAEHFVSHNHVPLLGALAGPEYPLALPVLAGISLLGALIAGLVREREAALLAVIASRAPLPRRANVQLPRPQAAAPRLRSAILALPDLGRAPPASAI